MYQFIGDASGTDLLDFQPLFADYENNPGTDSKFVSKFCTHLSPFMLTLLLRII